MNRALRLEKIIRYHGGSTSLAQIIRSIEVRMTNNLDEEDARGWKGLRHRFSAAVSELRADLESRTPMESLLWTKGKTPGKGLYSIVPAERKDGKVVITPRQLEIS